MSVVRGYLDAKGRITDAGYGPDIDWAESLGDVKLDAVYVTRETCWVILNSGFRYAVARKKWPELTAIFWDWNPACIDCNCIEPALSVLNHKGKIGAMVDIARIVREQGHESIVADAQDPPRLTRLPWIGKVTCWHLAKVLGADVVKPDVHLTRAAHAAGFESPVELCDAIRNATGDRLTVIDSVLWRYGEQRESRGWMEWKPLFDDRSAGIKP